MYIECCVAHVQCTDGYIHFMKCTDIAEPGTYIDMSFWLQLFLFRPGWLACRLGLAAAWCHAYSSASTLVKSATALGLARSLFTTVIIPPPPGPASPLPLQCRPHSSCPQGWGPVEAPPSRMLLLLPRPAVWWGWWRRRQLQRQRRLQRRRLAQVWSSNLCLTTLDLVQPLALTTPLISSK
jgi:hypothetical protein